MVRPAEDDRAHGMLKGFGDHISGKLPEGWGFALLLFETESATPLARYVSNAEPEGAAAALRAYADVLEERARK